MNVIFLSPGFPAEMPLFTRGLAEVGAKVFGLGEQPRSALPAEAAAALSDYLQVRSFGDEAAVVDEVRRWQRGRSIDRIECLWEPQMLLAAQLRETFQVPGLSVAQTIPLRDKEAMKQVIERAGLRVPRHGRARTAAEAWAAVERTGYPAILKPIDGAGSKDTHRCNDGAEFERALQATRQIPEISVEEYVDGEELTFDTVCAGGKVLFHNIAWYRPKPMIMAQNPWISPQNVCLRDTDAELPRAGKELGLRVLQALAFQTGFTHMEWYRTDRGEAVFGEIGGRPPGARLVHAMNYSCDIDLFRGWAEATCHGRLGQDVRKKYNAGMVFKRAQGEGRLLRYDGLEKLMSRYGPHIANIELTPIGQPKRDARQVIVGDGWIVCRHPDLQYTLEMCDAFATELRLFAGS
ncbi:MAG TPA: ATP-grasp domain-containing protein [Planctomycetota bacterium]|nr:ATP-grasp domain-containing protein [Planctomycetota bacterium]